jgi:hypothetical protein
MTTKQQIKNRIENCFDIFYEGYPHETKVFREPETSLLKEWLKDRQRIDQVIEQSSLKRWKKEELFREIEK